MTRIEMLREIVSQWQSKRIRIDGHKVYVDATTAAACVSVYDALNETNKEKYISLTWPKFVSVTWRLVA
jgi:hypothetical protein